MTFRKSHRILTGAAMIAIAAQAQAAQARIAYICPTLDTRTDELTVRISSGCMSSSTKYIGNDLVLEVDQETASIRVTGDMEYSSGGPIQTADCMGQKQIVLAASGVEARQYSVSYGDTYLDTIDLIEEPSPKQCLSPNRRMRVGGGGENVAYRMSFKDWNADPIESWSEWRGSSVLDLLSPILDGHPESMEGRATAEIDIKRMQWLRYPSSNITKLDRTPFIAVKIIQHGYLDDSVSGGRYFAEVRMEETGQWKLDGLWSQNMCARGEHAGQWTATRCP
ncbi:MAG: hypothetical protein AAGL68_11420 [Pseudomonadota bacterium]